MNEPQTITELTADKITDPVDPMRLEIDRDAVHELSASIKQSGLIQPITVRPVGDKFEVVAGHRRFTACKIAGLFKIPCIVREMDDKTMIEVRAHENLFRQDLDPVEEAIYIGKLVGGDADKIAEIARRMSKSVQWVEDRLAILGYPDNFLPAIRDKKISLGVAKWLAGIEDEYYRNMFFESAKNNGLAVWQAEHYFRQWQAGIFKPGEEIRTDGSELDAPARARLQTPCAKCGTMAVEPNLQSVFVHYDCPAGTTPKPREA